MHLHLQSCAKVFPLATKKKMQRLFFFILLSDCQFLRLTGTLSEILTTATLTDLQCLLFMTSGWAIAFTCIQHLCIKLPRHLSGAKARTVISGRYQEVATHLSICVEFSPQGPAWIIIWDKSQNAVFSKEN